MAESSAKLILRGDLHVRTWGDHSVVFHAASGDTHLLDHVALQGLLCLQEAALDAESLFLQMAERLELPPDDPDLRKYVQTLISQFDELGLLESADA